MFTCSVGIMDPEVVDARNQQLISRIEMGVITTDSETSVNISPSLP